MNSIVLNVKINKIPKTMKAACNLPSNVLSKSLLKILFLIIIQSIKKIIENSIPNNDR